MYRGRRPKLVPTGIENIHHVYYSFNNIVNEEREQKRFCIRLYVISHDDDICFARNISPSSRFILHTFSFSCNTSGTTSERLESGRVYRGEKLKLRSLRKKNIHQLRRVIQNSIVFIFRPNSDITFNKPTRNLRITLFSHVPVAKNRDSMRFPKTDNVLIENLIALRLPNMLTTDYTRTV